MFKVDVFCESLCKSWGIRSKYCGKSQLSGFF